MALNGGASEAVCQSLIPSPRLRARGLLLRELLYLFIKKTDDVLKIASAYMGRAKLCTEENEQPVLIARYFSQDYSADGRGFALSSCWPIH